MKSNLLSIILSLILISTTYGCSPNRDDSAMFRGNLERTGVYDVNSKMLKGEIKWKYNTKSETLSTPIVSQGIVYVSGQQGYFVAVNANTGHKSWDFTRENYGGSSPAVSNGLVYIGSMDYYVYAINIKTGLEKWKFETDEYIFSSPAVLDGLLYFGNFDGYFYALNASTGQEKWRFKTQGAASPSKSAGDYDLTGAIYSSPAISQGVVYFGSWDGYLYALNAKTGQEKWKFKSGYVISSTPAISNGVIYFGSTDGSFYAINTDGQTKWKFNSIDIITEPSKSTLLWEYAITSATISNGIVYFRVSYEGWENRAKDVAKVYRWEYLFAINAETGQIKWKTQIAGGTPTVSSNIVYIGDDEGYVFALNAETGQEIWKFKADSAIVSEIVVMDGIAYFCSKDGYLYALQ